MPQNGNHLAQALNSYVRDTTNGKASKKIVFTADEFTQGEIDEHERLDQQAADAYSAAEQHYVTDPTDQEQTAEHARLQERVDSTKKALQGFIKGLLRRLLTNI